MESLQLFVFRLSSGDQFCNGFSLSCFSLLLLVLLSYFVTCCLVYLLICLFVYVLNVCKFVFGVPIMIFVFGAFVRLLSMLWNVQSFVFVVASLTAIVVTLFVNRVLVVWWLLYTMISWSFIFYFSVCVVPFCPCLCLGWTNVSALDESVDGWPFWAPLCPCASSCLFYFCPVIFWVLFVYLFVSFFLEFVKARFDSSASLTCWYTSV